MQGFKTMNELCMGGRVKRAKGGPVGTKSMVGKDAQVGGGLEGGNMANKKPLPPFKKGGKVKGKKK